MQVIGGLDRTVAAARRFADDGDLRFAAELAGHAVFADPGHQGARDLLSDVLTRLGYGSECATWRNNFLTGAHELNEITNPIPLDTTRLAAALTVTQLFDSLAIRIDGERAWDTHTSIRWQFTDSGDTYRMELSNGALIHHPTAKQDPADLVITLTHRHLLLLLAGKGADGVIFDGDASVLRTIVSLTDQPDPAFAIVTP